MTTATVTEAGAEVLFQVSPGLDVRQAGAETLYRAQPGHGVTAAGVEVLYKVMPCATQQAQCWRLERPDGTVFRFTSLDRDLVWRGETYKACDSLQPSAAESSDQPDGVGSMQLAGILSDTAISEADLYAGRFDGAYVEAWLVDWGASGIMPRRQLAGIFGKPSFGEGGWNVEILGDGVRMQQTPLLSTYTPGCRWKNGGGFGGPECGKDLGPLTVTGTVTTGGERAFIDTTRAEGAGYFSRGVVTFTSGLNDGLTAEIRDHTAGGSFTLWPRLAAAIAAGDAYSMTPGCTYDKADHGGTNGCVTWGRIDSFGGYPDVPGQDSLSETPNAHQ